MAEGLAPGKLSAIRAAGQAGVKLGKIAREFGLPLAAVKRVIAGHHFILSRIARVLHSLDLPNLPRRPG